MANLNIGTLGFNSLSSVSKQVLLDFCYPVGSYFITQNTNLNTEEAVKSHFGCGVWKRITSCTLYASSNDNVGVNEGSNTVTLTEDNLPAHKHNRGNMNITGAFHIRQANGDMSIIARGSIGAMECQGYDTGFAQWANGINTGSWKYHPEKVTFDASRNWTGETSSFGKASPDAIDVRGEVRRVYIYYRES